MNLLKDDRTLKLDDAGLAAAEALGLYRDLEKRIQHSDLRTLLQTHTAAHVSLLERLEDARRERGDMPHGGDPERSHLEAAGASLRAMVLGGKTDAHFVESMLEAADNVAEQLDAALTLRLDTEIERPLLELRAANADFQRRLRELAEREGDV